MVAVGAGISTVGSEVDLSQESAPSSSPVSPPQLTKPAERITTPLPRSADKEASPSYEAVAQQS